MALPSLNREAADQTADLYWCLRELKLAWDAVSGTTIANCLHNPGILLDQNSDQNSCSDEDTALVRLREQLKKACAVDPGSAAELLDNKEEADVKKRLRDKAILDTTASTESDVNSLSSEESVTKSSNNTKLVITLLMAHEAPQTALKCF